MDFFSFKPSIGWFWTNTQPDHLIVTIIHIENLFEFESLATFQNMASNIV